MKVWRNTFPILFLRYPNHKRDIVTTNISAIYHPQKAGFLDRSGMNQNSSVGYPLLKGHKSQILHIGAPLSSTKYLKTRAN